jgi:hypothetical protein
VAGNITIQPKQGSWAAPKSSLSISVVYGWLHRFERITRYNLWLASIGNSLETVGSYTTAQRFEGIF